MRPERHLHVLRDAIRDDVSVGVGEHFPAAGHARQALDFTVGVLVLGLFEQRALHPQEGQARVARLVFCDLRHAMHHRHALGLVRLMGELNLVHANQGVPGALHAVQGLENFADFHRHLPIGKQRLERAHGRLVLRCGREDVAVLTDRISHTAQACLQHLSQSELGVEHVVGRRRDLDFLAKDLRQFTPTAGGLIEAIEGSESLCMGRVGIHHDAVARDGGVDVLDLDLVDLGRAQRELHVGVARRLP